MQEPPLPFEQYLGREDTGPYVENLTNSPSYEIAYYDRNFLESDIARSLRLQAEHTKPDSCLKHYGIHSTVIVFGSARFLPEKDAKINLTRAEKRCEENPGSAAAVKKLEAARRLVEMSRYYEQAREFARIVSQDNLENYKKAKNAGPGSGIGYEYVICTGGGPGIMEAANRGAHEVGAPSIGLNISLPFEQKPNRYITPELCFQFHYFAIRKLHFLLRAKALVVSPGGFGTFDELFEALTLRQTKRMQPIPIIIFGEDYWRRCIDLEQLVNFGVIDEEDLDLFTYTESPQKAWNLIKDFHADAET